MSTVAFLLKHETGRLQRVTRSSNFPTERQFCSPGDKVCLKELDANNFEEFVHKEDKVRGCDIILFTYLRSDMRHADTDQQGIKVGGRKISNLRYADDTALCAEGHQEASRLINEINDVGEVKSLKLNVKKTKTLYIGNDYQPIVIQNEEVERVEHFKYLGSIKTEDGFCTKDINARLAMGKQRMVQLENIWKDKTISMQLKLKLMKCLVWTVMSYGAEGWTLRQQDIQEMESAKMWLYRRLLRRKREYKRTNVSILKEIRSKRELSQYCNEKKASCYFLATQ